MMIGIVFVFAILIILLIYDSNTKGLPAKNNSQIGAANSASVSGNQPPMAMMEQIQALKDSWQADPQNFETNVSLGNAYFDISRFDQAVFYYKNAIRKKNDNPNILIDLSVSYFNLNKSDSALIFINDALKLEPDHLYGLYNAGIIYYNTHHEDEAVSIWKQLIEKHPGTRESESAKEFIRQIQTQQIKS